MNPTTWIAIYLPIFVLFFIILPNQQRAARNSSVLKIKKRKGEVIVPNEVLKKYIGRKCRISTGTFGVTINGKITNVNEKWIEVETKKGQELINSEFIQNIKITD